MVPHAAQHGDDGTQGGAAHDGGDHADGVGGGEGDGPFRDADGAHGQGCEARFALAVRPAVGCEQRRQAQAQGGDADGGGAGAHDAHMALPDHGHPEEEGRLVHGPAHVEGDHGAQHQAEEHLVAAAQVLERLGQPGHESLDGRPQQAVHDQTHHQGGQHGDHQDGHDGPQQPVDRQPPQQQDHAARQEARREPPQEPGPHRIGDEAAHEAGHQARTVGHAEGDVARQHGDHQGECGQADVHDHLQGRGLAEVRAGAGPHGGEGDGHGDEDAAAGHEGDHMGDAAEQIGLQALKARVHVGS